MHATFTCHVCLCMPHTLQVMSNFLPPDEDYRYISCSDSSLFSDFSSPLKQCLRNATTVSPSSLSSLSSSAAAAGSSGAGTTTTVATESAAAAAPTSEQDHSDDEDDEDIAAARGESAVDEFADDNGDEDASSGDDGDDGAASAASAASAAEVALAAPIHKEERRLLDRLSSQCNQRRRGQDSDNFLRLFIHGSECATTTAKALGVSRKRVVRLQTSKLMLPQPRDEHYHSVPHDRMQLWCDRCVIVLTPEAHLSRFLRSPCSLSVVAYAVDYPFGCLMRFINCLINKSLVILFNDFSGWP